MAGEEDDDLTINIDAELDGGAADGMDDLASKAQAAADAADALKSSLDDVGSADVSGLSDSLDEVAGKEQDAADAADALKTSLDDVADADLGGVADALDEVTQKEQDAADAAKAYAAELDAAGEGGQTLADMAASLESVTKAADGAGEALAEVAKAEDDAASAGGGLDDAGKPLDDMAASAGKAADEMDRAAAAEKELLAGESPFEQGGGSGGAAGGGAAQGDQSGGGASGRPGGQVDWPAVLNQPGAQQNAASGTAQAAQGGGGEGGYGTTSQRAIGPDGNYQYGNPNDWGGGGGGGGGDGPGAANNYMGSMRAAPRGLNMLMGRAGSQYTQAAMGLSRNEDGSFKYGTAGAVGGGIMAFDQISKNFATAMTTLDDSFTSTETKVCFIASSIPIVGQISDAIFNLMDAFTGLKETLRENAEYLADTNNQIQVQTKLDSQLWAADKPMREAEANLAANQAIRTDYGTAPDSVSDPVGYDRWVKGGQLAAKVTAAQRKGMAAGINADAAQASVDTLMQRSNQLQDYAATQAQTTQQQRDQATWYDNNKGGIDTSLTYEATNNAEAMANDAELLTRLKELQTDITAQVNAEHDARLAMIAVDQQHLDILTQQEAMARQQYEAIGGMDVNTRQNVLQSLQQAQDAGFETLSSTQKGLIGQAGGQAWLKQQYVQQASQDDTTQQIRQFIGAAGGGSTDSLDDLAQQRLTVQQQVTVEINTDTDMLAQAIRDRLDPLKAEIDVIIKRQADEVRREFKLKEWLARNQKS